MSRNKFNAGYIGVDKTSSKKGALTSEERYVLDQQSDTSESESTTYDLDGTNILSVAPTAHFDAAKMNGTDSSANPLDGGSVSGAWVSRVGDYSATATSASLQPVWNEADVDIGLPAYVYFDEDLLDLEMPVAAGYKQPFLVWSVGRKNLNTWYNPVGFRNIDSAKPYGLNFSHNNETDYMYHSHVNGAPPVGYPLSEGAADQIWITKRAGSDPWNTRIYHNGNNINTNAIGTVTQPISFQLIGGGHSSYKHEGRIYELMIFAGTGETSTADLNVLNAYADSKYILSSATF